MTPTASLARPNGNNAPQFIQIQAKPLVLARTPGLHGVEELIPSKPVTSIVLDPASPRNARTLYAGVFDEGVFKSTDDGRTWALKKAGLGHPDNMRVYRVILHPDNTLFAIICAKRPASGQPLMPEGTGLYRSKDGAKTREKINASKPLLYARDGRTIAKHLLPAMGEPGRMKSLQTEQIPAPLTVAGASSEEFTETVHLSRHRRGFPWPDGKGRATSIDVFHVWCFCG